MARRRHRRNYNNAGEAHELTFSCYRGYPLLVAERNCNWLGEAINEARDRLEFDLWAFVFMPDHVHLLVYPREKEYDISKIRSAIKHPTSKRALAWMREHAPESIEELTRTRGRRTETLFWQSGGGYDRNVQEGHTLLRMIDYIHLNPVRKGLVERAEDWRWSSAKHYLGERGCPLFVDPIPSEWIIHQLS